MQQVLSIFGGNQMDYAELYLWDIPVVWSKPESGDRELISLRDRTPRIAAEGCDIEALIHSEMGRQMVLQFEDYIRYGDEMDPAYVQKWHTQGLDKQVMGRDDFYHRWALFTPVSAREKSSRRYPLLFVLHGSSMPINWEECSGFLPIAAREELIVCIPQDHSLQNLLRLYDILTRDYPVDPGRVYCTGYSQGSAQTNALLFARPELLAAAAPCGCLAGPFSMGMEPEERVQHAAQVRVPILTVCGQQEGLYLVPYYKDAPQCGMYGVRRTNPRGREAARNRLPVQAPNAAYKVESLNLRLRSCNCPEVTLDEVLACAESEDLVCRRIGMPFSKTEVRRIYGCDHYIGTVTDRYGDDTLQIVSVDNFPHWPAPSMAELVWEFLRHYSRDPETGALRDDRKS